MRTIEELFNPFPGLDDTPELGKFSHVHKEGDRVRVKETGHRGVIQHLGAQNRIYVKLDSDHVISCSPDELEPSDFPLGDREQPAATPADSLLESKLASFLPHAGGLTKALREDRVSPRDRANIQILMERVRKNQDYSCPFGLVESDEVKDLRKYAEKYQGTANSGHTSDGGDVLNKVQLSPDTDPEFSMGQTVRHKRDGRKGKIVKLDYGFARVQHDTGEFHVPCGELEACAA